MIFEGEYLNGEKNGKGKEYYKYYNHCGLDEMPLIDERVNYKSNLRKFEGEYLNGKKWTGRGYNFDGNLEFELKNGNGNKRI